MSVIVKLAIAAAYLVLVGRIGEKTVWSGREDLSGVVFTVSLISYIWFVVYLFR